MKFVVKIGNREVKSLVENLEKLGLKVVETTKTKLVMMAHNDDELVSYFESGL